MNKGILAVLDDIPLGFLIGVTAAQKYIQVRFFLEKNFGQFDSAPVRKHHVAENQVEPAQMFPEKGLGISAYSKP